MFHICKQDWMGCAIATTAAIAHLSYDEVVVLADGVSPAELRESEEMRRLLEGVTHMQWVGNCQRQPKAVSQTLFPDHPIAALLNDRPESPRFSQWVAIRSELIHDPALQTGCHIRRYVHRNWIVAYMFEPADPSKFHELKRTRRRFVLQELAEQMSDGLKQLRG